MNERKAPTTPDDLSPTERDQVLWEALQERGFPANPMNAARAGWYAALKHAAAPAAPAQPAEPECEHWDGRMCGKAGACYRPACIPKARSPRSAAGAEAVSPQLVGILAAIAASQARIASMQAFNQHRLSLGRSIGYHEDAFLNEAQHLDALSVEARNCQS